MKNLLVDSSVIISFYDSTDANHSKATQDLQINNLANVKLWVVTHVIDEVSSILLKRNFEAQLLDFIELLQKGQINLFSWLEASEERGLIFETLARLANQHGSKISFTDMYQLVFVSSQQLSNVAILSYDHHLQHAG